MLAAFLVIILIFSSIFVRFFFFHFCFVFPLYVLDLYASLCLRSLTGITSKIFKVQPILEIFSFFLIEVIQSYNIFPVASNIVFLFTVSSVPIL